MPSRMNWARLRHTGKATMPISSEFKIPMEERSPLIEFGLKLAHERGVKVRDTSVRSIANALKPGHHFSHEEAFLYLRNLKRFISSRVAR